MARPARRARPLLWPALACLLAVATVGDTPGNTALPVSAGLPATPAVASVAGGKVAVPPPRAPIRLDLPSIAAHAPIRPVAVTGTALDVPDDPAVVGWWQAGGRVGQPGAALVLDGHVDNATTGPGALFHLAALVPGDTLVLTTDDGVRHPWTVDTVRSYPKAALPVDLFAPATPPRLVVVSCGGRFDRRTRQYADNIVAIAHQA